MAIMDTIEDFKDSVGDKGFYVILGLIGVAFVYFAKTGSTQNDSTLVDATQVTNYPSVSANADVVISAINQNADADKKEIMSAISSTNNYIEKATETTSGKIDSVASGISNLQNTADNIKNTTNNIQNNMLTKDYYEQLSYKTFVGNKQVMGVTHGVGFDTSLNYRDWIRDIGMGG